ncbi:uncharacterized protein FIBRA_06934 [Fibroporia radiculosa]|uniref:Uncharacterized protein n=1 Tax=Fibroporia radiculosa TaxID=599839 RepID=J4H4C3_9APHY|nr:uncharacterized protein FIBRA_06934 [Fibroporia radiculosa]CCM04744.1 predicted protein [Fibroporia radiculosa]
MLQAPILLSSPSTPSRSPRFHNVSWSNPPHNSSPLACDTSSPVSSPGADAFARRRGQYKQHTASSPTATRLGKPPKRRVTLGGELPSSSRGISQAAAVPTEEAPRKAFLRERFRARCLERSQKDRERKIKGRRCAQSDTSSDGDDEVMDNEEEDDEEFINDELFRRLISSGKRKQQHEYRLSYAFEVGSSFDPDMEDMDEWERHIQPFARFPAVAHEPISTIPEDLDEEELAAYAEEYDLHLEDLCPEDVFSLSDVDDITLPDEDMQLRGKGKERAIVAMADDDVDMAMP